MTAYRGRMETALLNDRQIRPTEYQRWADAVARFERRPQDRVTVEKYLREIAQGGLREPVLIGVSDQYHDVHVSDGHHRAVALLEARATEFPFRWCWLKWASTPMQSGPFPYCVLGLPGGPKIAPPRKRRWW
ncbi:hypothetical protein ACXZ65_34400 [Streptomyces aculeolatus]